MKVWHSLLGRMAQATELCCLFQDKKNGKILVSFRLCCHKNQVFYQNE